MGHTQSRFADACSLSRSSRLGAVSHTTWARGSPLLPAAKRDVLETRGAFLKGSGRPEFCGVGPRDAAQGCVYGDAPLLKEPFGDVDTITVLLALGPELTRGRIHLCHEVQLPDPHFKFGRQSEHRRNGTRPIRVFSFALRRGKSNRCRHMTRSYYALGDCAAESSHGWRMVCGSGRRGDIFGRYGSSGGNA